MAGNYDDAPNRRFAHDVDGTVGTYRNSSGSGSISEITPSNMVKINSEADDYWELGSFGQPARWLTMLFPELRDFDGIFWAYSDGGTPGTCETSPDTTNGVDGAWTQQVANLADYNIVNENFRDEITGLSVSAQSGIRVLVNSTGLADQRIKAWHMYGTISAGETPDRILFLDTENSDAEFVKPLDFAEVPRGQTQTRTFKIINNSASKSINTIVVAAEDLYLNAGGWYEFSNDGNSWVTSYAVGNLANGAEETIHLRQVVPDGETLGLQTARIEVSHASVT